MSRSAVGTRSPSEDAYSYTVWVGRGPNPNRDAVRDIDFHAVSGLSSPRGPRSQAAKARAMTPAATTIVNRMSSVRSNGPLPPEPDGTTVVEPGRWLGPSWSRSLGSKLGNGRCDAWATGAPTGRRDGRPTWPVGSNGNQP